MRDATSLELKTAKKKNCFCQFYFKGSSFFFSFFLLFSKGFFFWDVHFCGDAIVLGFHFYVSPMFFAFHFLLARFLRMSSNLDGEFTMKPGKLPGLSWICDCSIFEKVLSKSSPKCWWKNGDESHGREHLL